MGQGRDRKNVSRRRFRTEVPRVDLPGSGGGGGGGGGDDDDDGGGGGGGGGGGSEPEPEPPDDGGGGGGGGGGGSDPEPDPEPSFSASDVSVNSCTGLPSEATVGQTVSVTITVNNSNADTATGTLVATTGSSGNLIDSRDRSFEVGPNRESDFTVDLSLPSTTGDYSIDASVTNVTELVGGL